MENGNLCFESEVFDEPVDDSEDFLAKNRDVARKRNAKHKKKVREYFRKVLQDGCQNRLNCRRYIEEDYPFRVKRNQGLWETSVKRQYNRSVRRTKDELVQTKGAQFKKANKRGLDPKHDY